ncbi:ABC transporter permease [Vagococcus silagei]|uniref:ABC transporter permease n=1 Tax=Vagococcus silagei TaxID=2508885 RepID=A0A4S3B4X8_9ENTE|nr:ABC transporter permease [Vagococcus silagei]THB60880.1 ABC transporter permease [Vagococcus silagei]
MPLIYKNRLAKHQKKMMKYLKYILNDHFILVCTFALGGLALYYSGFIKALSETQLVWVKPVVIVIWLLSLFMGQLATLLVEADQVFLLAKEWKMPEYFKKVFQYSLIFPTVLLGLILGVLFPALLASDSFSLLDFILFVLISCSLKASDLIIQLTALYNEEPPKKTTLQLIWFVLSAITLGLTLYLHPISGMILSLLIFLLFLKILKTTWKNNPLNWSQALDVETKRMKRLYRFINLFVDVPNLSGEVKRRRYLDKWLAKIELKQSNTFYYLYVRVFLRGSEYISLVLRLTIIGCLLVLTVTNQWLQVGLAVLFMYLIVFQLIPIYNAFDYMLMSHLYPVAEKQKELAVKKLLSQVSLVVAALFTIFFALSKPTIINLGIFVAAMIAEYLIFFYFYLAKRIKKVKK